MTLTGRGARALVLLVVASCAPNVRVSQSSRVDHASLILAREELLAQARRSIQSGDPTLRAAYESLINSANRALNGEPPSVMQKRKIPPSGDRHDYMSLAPYWWPDPAKPDGLPYVQRDGVVNPESRVDHDGTRFHSMVDAVQALALAHYLTGDAQYSRRAATLLRVWFVDPATRMNPNLRYAQAIPGITEGRGIGIIDIHELPGLLDAIRLLEGSSALPDSVDAPIVAWSRSFLAWLRESKNGQDERAAENNHGTWYDTQVVALALFVGDTALAREVLTRDTPRRIAAQIRPDGSQSLELERTRPLHYSLFNLDAYTHLAEMARRVGVNLWGYESPNGASITKALLFIAPYADSTVKLPKPDVTPVQPEVFVAPFRRAQAAHPDARFGAVIEKRTTRPDRSRLRLLYPDAPASVIGLDSTLERALQGAAEKLKRSAVALDPANGYPRFTRADGSWEVKPSNQWTSGFFAGSLWYMYQLTRQPEWKDLAERWTAGLEKNKSNRSTHDLGFMIFNSFGHGYLLTGNPHYKEVVLDASRSLVTRYNPRVGAIKSWDTERGGDRRQTWKYPVIIDNLMNLELLFWSASNGGDSSWKSIAQRHALTSARTHVRSDGSTAHVALFDPESGVLERTVTWQGFSDSSVWARGQAWAIYGFTNAYARTGRRELLNAATETADYFISHLPDDGIPYWDFSDPGLPKTERDASAAAIAASGLLDLARRTTPSAAIRYRSAAQRILTSLARNYMAGPESSAVLEHAVGGKPQNTEVDVGLVYADYYFIEALLRLRGVFLE